jgi:hypothetical protein
MYYSILELVNPINILSTFLKDMNNRQGQECEQALALLKGLNLGGLNLASAAMDLLLDNAQGEALGEPKIKEIEQIAAQSDGNNDNDQ